MAEKIKSVIVGKTEVLGDSFQMELAPIAEFAGKFADPSTAYTAIKDLHPGAIFIDVDNERDGGLALARHLKNTLPATAVFLVSREKEPDAILEGLRIGVADFLVFPGPDGKIRKAVRKALGRAEAGGHSGEITAVFSMKGGQGVTSIATNLADHIHTLTGDKVLLVDMNLYMGDVSVFLELPATYTPFDMLKDIERMDENLLFSSLTLHPGGFYILTAPDEISDADQVSGEDINRILNVLGAYLDHIVIDLPHDFAERSLAVLEAADTILLLVQQSMPVIKSVQKAIKLFEELGFDEKKVRIVLNRYMEKNELTPDDISYVLNWPVFARIANDFHSLTDVTNKGKTLNTARPDTRVNKDMEALSILLTGIKPEMRPDGGWSDIIGRFFPMFKEKGRASK